MAVAEARVTPRFKKRYDDEIRQRLVERFGYSSPMRAPRLVKITLNMGVGDAKQDTNMLDAATEQLAVIAGQRPNVPHRDRLARRRDAAGDAIAERDASRCHHFGRQALGDANRERLGFAVEDQDRGARCQWFVV